MSASILPCSNVKCGFDLASFRATVKVGSSGASNSLHCPACGSVVELRLEAFGVFKIDDGSTSRFVAWKTRNSLLTDKPELTLGQFKVQLNPAPEVMQPEDVAFRQVAVFKGVDGSWQVPTLPVRPDRMSFLDMSEPLEPGRMEHNEYVVKLRLRGIDAPLELRLPVMLADPADRSTTADVDRRAFRGVNLRMWPNVSYEGWKQFYLSLAAVDEDGKKMFGPGRSMRAFWIAKGKAREIAKSTAGGNVRVACTDARPEWIGLEFKDDKGGVIGGGLWQVPAAQGRYVNRSIRLGADFGTSNTAFAWREGDGKPSLIPNSVPYFVLKSGNEPSVHQHLEMWVPRTGFGPMKDLLASELLFANPVTTLGSEEDFRKLKPIEDYCISISGVRVGYDEKAHVVSGLKWRDGIEPTSLRKSDLFTPLQEAYLDFVTFLTLGNIYSTMGDAAPGGVDIKFSYPLVFKKSDIGALSAVWLEVARRIEASTGLRVSIDQSPLDEATAATGMLRPKKDTVRLVVDIGGGTTDIAMLWSTRNQGDTPAPVYVTSVRFAGSNILQAFQGMNNSPNCLLPTTSPELLKRKIRETTEIRDAFASGDLLNSARERVANNRVKMFYGYLLEYVARLIVAPLAAERFVDISNKALQVKLPLQVEVLLLGNGWAFGDLVDSAGVAEMTESILGRRTGQIADTLGRDERPEIELSVKRPEGVSHPKAAVAMGLVLIDEASASGGGRKIVTRRIVGINTKVGDTEVPWYQEVRGRGERAPEDQEPLEAGAYLEWDAGSTPKFPKNLRSPHELDPDLDKSARGLMKAVGVDDEWLQASPFEVLLQDLFALAVCTDGTPYGN